MTSSLYYSNLGVDDRDVVNFRNQVHHSLREFNDYLERAMERLRQRDYSYDIKIGRVELYLPASTKWPSPGAPTGSFFLDKGCEAPLDLLSADPKRKVLAVRTAPPGIDHIYLRDGEDVRSVDVDVRAHVEAILPRIEEDREDEALDFLCYQADRLYDGNNGRGPRVLRANREKETLELDGVPAGPTVRARADVNVVKQQLLAIQELATRPKEHHIPLLRLLLRSRDVEWKGFEPARPKQFFVLTDEQIDGCQEQRDFVATALSTPDFAILEGPPGSGKTTTIIELIIQLVRSGKRVMVVASTHVAVDNILERLSEERPEGTLLDRFGIIPLRIGKESVVSERISKYCLDNVVRTQRTKMRDRLEALRSRTPAQQKWYDALCQEGNSPELLSSMCLDMANLVCGTTIGILRAPSITAASDGSPPFDYLVLDEASKTTFQEFLVPALHARRWVLSGDTKQLAPYVEESNIVDNLRSIGERFNVDEAVRMACLATLDATISSNRIGRGTPEPASMLLVEDGSPVLGLIRNQIEGVQGLLRADGENDAAKRFRSLAAVVATEEPNDVISRARIASAALVVAPRSLRGSISEHMPPGHKLVDQAGGGKANRSREERGWEEEIAWRLSRMYEVQDQDARYDGYRFEIEALLPYCLDAPGIPNGWGRSASAQINNGIEGIRRIALPSVLNLLMDGFETKRQKSRLEVALFNGLPKRVLDPRRVLLTYQHRMHPEISAFPRARFYDEKALRDGRDMEAKRAWSYKGFGHRCTVLNVRPDKEEVSGDGANFNRAEVDLLTRYLKDLLKWTEKNPKKEGPWTVALLTFYKGQEKLLSNMVRSELKAEGKRYFDLARHNVDLQVCNVDRFQGHEADVVFLSFVRSWQHHRGIGFLDNSNRLNVALTRARYQMVVLADTSLFVRKGTPALRAFMEGFQGDINYRRQSDDRSY